MARSIIYKHYQRALNQWPVDILRPELSFQKAMRRRIDRKFPLSTAQPQDKVVANDALATPVAKSPVDEKAELEQVTALFSFLEDRYSKKYPLSDRTMKPTSNPTYYEDLLKEFDEAPKRSWFAGMVNRWKGFLRFS